MLGWYFSDIILNYYLSSLLGYVVPWCIQQLSTSPTLSPLLNQAHLQQTPPITTPTNTLLCLQAYFHLHWTQYGSSGDQMEVVAMATKRGIRMRSWDTSHLKVRVQFVCFMYLMRFPSLVPKPYFQIFNVACKRLGMYWVDDLYPIGPLFSGKGRQDCTFKQCSLPFFLYRVAVWWILGAWASHLHSLPPLTTITRSHPLLHFSAPHVCLDLCPWSDPGTVLWAKCLCWYY